MSDRNGTPDLITTRFEGPAPEVAISTDMIKRGLLVGPVLIAVCGVIWGLDGVWSSAYGIAIVLTNFALAAGLVRDAAWISFPALGSTIIITHLGLLFWEMKFVALSLAHPGLKPTKTHSAT